MPAAHFLAIEASGGKGILQVRSKGREQKTERATKAETERKSGWLGEGLRDRRGIARNQGGAATERNDREQPNPIQDIK